MKGKIFAMMFAVEAAVLAFGARVLLLGLAEPLPPGDGCRTAIGVGGLIMLATGIIFVGTSIGAINECK